MVDDRTQATLEARLLHTGKKPTLNNPPFSPKLFADFFSHLRICSPVNLRVTRNRIFGRAERSTCIDAFNILQINLAFTQILNTHAQRYSNHGITLLKIQAHNVSNNYIVAYFMLSVNIIKYCIFLYYI